MDGGRGDGTARAEQARRTWRLLAQITDATGRQLGELLSERQGLDLAWFEVLAQVAENGGRTTQRELLEHTTIGQSGLSRALSRMEEAHLVSRLTVPVDRRNLSVELTDLGRERLRRAAPAYADWIVGWLGGALSDAEATVLLELLERVRAASVTEPGREPLRAQGLAPIGSAITSTSSDAVAVADAIVVRDTLEPLILAEAARYATQSDLPDLHRILAGMAGCSSDGVAYLRADWQLHRRLARITPNAALERTYAALVDTLEAHVETVLPSLHLEEYLQHRLRMHVRIVDAVAAHDVEAAVALASEHRLSPADAVPPEAAGG